MKRAFPVLLAVVLLLFALPFAQAEEDALQTVLVAVDPATLPEEQAALLIPADPETAARVLDSAPVCPETDAAFRDPENGRDRAAARDDAGRRRPRGRGGKG